jgi:hypothetical protein
MRRPKASQAAQKGLELCKRYEESGQARDLAGGIKLLRASLARPGAPGELGSVLGNLATALWSRFEDTRDRDALDESIAMHSAAISGDWLGAEDRFYWMHDLARALRVRYDESRDSADLDTAITLGQASKAVSYRPPAGIWTARMSERAGDLEERARLRLAAAGQAATMAALADADVAVALRREVISAASADYRDHAGLLSSLGAALVMRAGLAEVCGHPEDAAADVAEAVQQHRAAALLTPDTHPLASRITGNLCRALTEQARRAGDRALLEEAAEAARLGFRQAGPDLAATAAAALVTVLAQRADGATDPAHISDLIDALQDPSIGPAAVPRTADLQLATGAALVRHYWLTGELPDLTRAVEHYRGVLSVHNQASGADLAAARSGLSATLRIRYERMGETADLTEATALARSALSAAVGAPTA